MDYTIEHVGEQIRVAVDGDLDAAMVQELRPEFDAFAADGRTLVVDLTKVDFIDSAGVGLIVRTYKTRQPAKAAMAIVGASGQPRELLRTTQIDRLIPFHATLDDMKSN